MLNDGGKVTANMSVYIHVIIPTYIVHVKDIQDTHSRAKYSCHSRIRVEQYLFVVSFKSLTYIPQLLYRVWVGGTPS